MPNVLDERADHVDSPQVTEQPRRATRRPMPLRVVAAAIAVVILVVLAFRLVDLLPSWGNPVQERVVDRSTPPLMLALDDLSEYHAATGTFQVVIDQERDRRYVPSVISGERTAFLATGTVDAHVDFSALGADRVKMSADRRTVTISLPAPRLGQVRVDPTKSRVLDRDRGVVERVGAMFEDNPSGEGELYSLAEKKVARAAANSDLQHRAEDNTRAMLTSLTRSLGFTKVTIRFDSAV